jgi:adenylate cyclase
MKHEEIAALTAWIAEAGLAGQTETELVQGFCQKLNAAGLPIARAIVLMDTLHPIYEGRAFRWERELSEATFTEYGRTTEGEFAERWRSSPFYKLLESGETMLRRRINQESLAEFSNFRDLKDSPITDYVAIVNPFAAGAAIGEMDCFYSSWMTDRPEGFLDRELAALRRLAPFLGLAIKSGTLARIASTLVETYLGRDAGQRVLHGRIARGVADRIEAVLWFSDLRNYTRISDTAPPEQIIPLLNDYAEAIVSAIHDRHGDVLKLIGDGVLAIFPTDQRWRACGEALDAADAARSAVATLNQRRAAEGLPTTEMYLGLHIGEVFYGNIGSKARLDFTVIGPAVNEVSRIAAMCRSVDQPVLLSNAFAAALGGDRALVSVGRYALRGVSKPQELFTLDVE